MKSIFQFLFGWLFNDKSKEKTSVISKRRVLPGKSLPTPINIWDCQRHRTKLPVSSIIVLNTSAERKHDTRKRNETILICFRAKLLE